VAEEQKIAKNESGLIETVFENILWSTRFLVLFAVISSLFASMVLFIIGTIDIAHVVKQTWMYYVFNDHTFDVHTTIIADIIGAIDIYLIAVVLLIFSFGLYELFISDINPAHGNEASPVLQIHTLDALKDKIAQVIVMALVVKYFQLILNMEFTTVLEMVYFAVSIFALALALYFLHKAKKA